MADPWEEAAQALQSQGGVSTSAPPSSGDEWKPTDDLKLWNPNAQLPKPRPFLDWSKVASNTPHSILRLIQGTAPGPTSPAPDMNPSGRFSQAHPHIADQYPIVASAADSLEELVHKVMHLPESFEEDPAGTTQLVGNLARGVYEGATSTPVVTATKTVAKVPGKIISKLPDEAGSVGGYMGGHALTGNWYGGLLGAKVGRDLLKGLKNRMAGAVDPLLEDIAQGQMGKKFENLTAAQQDIVRTLATRLKQPGPPIGAGPPSTPSNGTVTPATSVPHVPLGPQSVDEFIAQRKAATLPPPTPIRQPVWTGPSAAPSPASPDFSGTPPPEAGVMPSGKVVGGIQNQQPLAPKPPGPPIGAGPAAEDLAASLTGTRPAPGQVVTIAPEGPTLPSEAYQSSATSQKARALALYLKEGEGLNVKAAAKIPQELRSGMLRKTAEMVRNGGGQAPDAWFDGNVGPAEWDQAMVELKKLEPQPEPPPPKPPAPPKVKPPKQTVTMQQVLAAAKRQGQTVEQVKATLKHNDITILP